MKTNSGTIIRSIRKETGLSREDMAEQLFISTRTLARIESGEAGMDVWQFITSMELLGSPSEDFWLLYLDSGEYANYRDYKRLKRQLANGDWSEVRSIIAELEKSLLFKQPLVKQFVAYVKTAMQMDVPPAENMAAFLDVMRMSKPNFDMNKIAEYRMTYNEINIAVGIAECLAALGEPDRAVAMLQDMIEGRDKNRVSEEDKAMLLPFLHFVLCGLLRNSGRHKEALRACNNAVDACREHNNLMRIPEMLVCMEECYHKLGEEEHIYKTHLVRAYHAAYAIGRNDFAVVIKEIALKNYGIDI